MKKLIPVLLSISLAAIFCAAQQAPSANVNSQSNQATASESPSQNAQTPGSPGQQEQSAATQGSNSAQPQSISGCLGKSGTAYTLTDSQNGTVYQLSGDTSHLSSDIGHEMQITGQTMNQANENATGAPSGNSGKSFVFQVNSTKRLAGQCGPSGATANGPSL